MIAFWGADYDLAVAGSGSLQVRIRVEFFISLALHLFALHPYNLSPIYHRSRTSDFDNLRSTALYVFINHSNTIYNGSVGFHPQFPRGQETPRFQMIMQALALASLTRRIRNASVIANAVGSNTRRFGCGVKANEFDISEGAFTIGFQMLDTSRKDSSSPLPL